ncbi:MAG: hypothetical protein EB064_09565, partial [Betaproteobacteria bacterium]|nr:hypothetical protein [Betaproteobacteria bacterium]
MDRDPVEGTLGQRQRQGLHDGRADASVGGYKAQHEAGLDAALADAREDNWLRLSEAIMTTDTVAKAFGVQLEIGGCQVSVTGVSKGAGMIRPNMATMLGFIATDACVSPAIMQALALALAEGSFNRVTV